MTIADKQKAPSVRWLVAAWSAIFAAAVFAYWPGLDGPWLFDDFGSLAKLGDLGGIRDWERFKAFVFGGTAGPTGRPLSLVTFLIDGRDWPTDAWPFKRTNLVIHILNGGLLGLFIRQILVVLRFEKRKAAEIAAVTVACWLLHPFLVSTTLYIVQRMAQLSTLFIFAGLVGYMWGRPLVETKPMKAYMVMSVSLVAFTFLAMISKENGVLLPMFALLLELTIFPAIAATRLNRYWLAIFVAAPSAIIVLYLASRAIDARFFEIVPPRDFSIYERLLTQSRVLVDYLLNWFLPKLYTTGVFQDHYIKSTSLFTPLSTLFAAIFHIGLLTLAVAFRRKLPLLSLAILFFYTGHLIESTVLNLELYFEHRNYLSAALLFLPVVAFARQKLNVRHFVVLSALVLVLLGGFTRYCSGIWQDFDLMAATSARKAPTSARAQANYAANLFNAGHVDAALDVLDRAVENVGSGKPLLVLQRLVLACHTQRLEPEAFEHAADFLSHTAYDARMINMYRELTDAIIDRNCPAIPVSDLQSLFESMLLTPPNNDPRSMRFSQLHYFLGYIFAHTGQPAAAADAFMVSLDSRPDPSSAMAMASVLATNGYPEEALRLSDVALQLLAAVNDDPMQRTNVTEADIRSFQDNVRGDRVNLPTDDTPDPVE